ncbi:MAG TPA: SAM-dependent methyltransferase [Spirochaetia bacterium]|nr:SAM-dependent methyltransferase [Spirochaetia bacterium]
MAKIESFNNYAEEYDKWFDENNQIFKSELKALKEFIPEGLIGLEIGAGTGRFSKALNISLGIEPSLKMAEIARKKGVNIIQASAEKLPLMDNTYDFVLLVTTICFLDDLEKSFLEIHRVLKYNGFVLIGFIEKNSILGKHYQEKKQNSRFYRDATFYSVHEVLSILKQIGFKKFTFRQTLFNKDINDIHPVKPGYGEGSFIVIKAKI